MCVCKRRNSIVWTSGRLSLSSGSSCVLSSACAPALCLLQRRALRDAAMLGECAGRARGALTRLRGAGQCRKGCRGGGGARRAAAGRRGRGRARRGGRHAVVAEGHSAAAVRGAVAAEPGAGAALLRRHRRCGAWLPLVTRRCVPRSASSASRRGWRGRAGTPACEGRLCARADCWFTCTDGKASAVLLGGLAAAFALCTFLHALMSVGQCNVRYVC